MSYLIDIYNNIFYYQSNLDPKLSLNGLIYYPVKDIKIDSLYLNTVKYFEVQLPVPKDYTGDDGGLINQSIYSYEIFKDNFYGQFNENEIICPYTNIFISEDYKYLFLELNEDSLIHNVNNKSLVNITEKNSTLITYNSSAMYLDGISEIIKIENKFINVNSLDSDDIIVDNN
jgi:hypothetical protein